jgi:CHAD domain-containing protein
MSTATLRDELQDELRHIRDLVFIRDLLRERGETSTELSEYAAVINAARAQLAESAKSDSARYAAAA